MKGKGLAKGCRLVVMAAEVSSAVWETRLARVLGIEEVTRPLALVSKQLWGPVLENAPLELQEGRPLAVQAAARVEKLPAWELVRALQA